MLIMQPRRLSAYLYNATGNDTYLNSAQDAHQFIQSYLYDSGNISVMDAIDLIDCTMTNHFNYTFNTGLYLEALTMLSKHDSDMKSLLVRFYKYIP